jgi:hypothetical protein
MYFPCDSFVLLGISTIFPCHNGEKPLSMEKEFDLIAPMLCQSVSHSVRA